MPRPILLIGMMLSGKSTIGRLLATHLSLPFVDLDEEIALRTSRSIPDWFALSEAAFRAVERDTLESLLSDPSPRVIAAGGGAMEDEASRRRAHEQAFVIYLEATADELLARHSGPTGRPLLDSSGDPRARLAELLSRRQQNYRAAQHLTVPARLSPDQLVEAILEAYAQHPDD